MPGRRGLTASVASMHMRLHHAGTHAGCPSMHVCLYHLLLAWTLLAACSNHVAAQMRRLATLGSGLHDIPAVQVAGAADSAGAWRGAPHAGADAGAWTDARQGDRAVSGQGSGFMPAAGLGQGLGLGGASSGVMGSGGLPPGRVTIFLGIQTCADTSPADTRRARLRALARTTWLPRLPPCMMYRFVAGRLGSHAVQVEEEGRVHGDFMLLDHEERYTSLTAKTALYFHQAARLFPNFLYYFKVDDDVHVYPRRLLPLATTWAGGRADYIGSPNAAYVQRDGKYAEPMWGLFPSGGYPVYMNGPFYALSAHAVSMVFTNYKHLRLYANEDVAMGMWVLAHQLSIMHEPRVMLLQRGCPGPGVVAFWLPGNSTLYQVHAHCRLAR